MKMRKWKYYPYNSEFAKLFLFNEKQEEAKNKFITKLFDCATENIKLLTIGVEDGYCVCIEVQGEVFKEEIDDVCQNIDAVYLEGFSHA